MQNKRRPIARLALACCATLAACGDTADPDRRHSVLLISLDTLRADHLSLYGYHRPTSPQLEELARRATVYRRAQAAAPWTLPSHASIFTGLYPYEHGAHTYPVEDIEERQSYNNAAPLADEYVTLAELFHENGYRTGAVVANESFLAEKWNLSQGFDFYDNERGVVGEINARALAWLDESQGEPFFLFLNYMDTHRPYNAAAREGFPDRSQQKRALKQLIPKILRFGRKGNEKHIALVVDQYDTAIANLDEGLGELFAALRERGVFDDCLVVVTADHGEFIGEHDLIEHSKHLYQEVVHVPLIIKAPGQEEGAEDDGWISHVHLPKLILEHSGFPATGLDERSSFTSHWPRQDVFSENYGVRLHDLRKPWGERLDRLRRAAHMDTYKLIESSDGTVELYDLAKDPNEQHNLGVLRPELTQELRRRIQEGLLSRSEGQNAGFLEMTDDDRAVMEALGYAGGEDEE